MQKIMKVIKWLSLSFLLHQKDLKGLVLLAMFSIAYSIGVATFSMVNFLCWFDANVISFFLQRIKKV
jgi:hypothetical protein